MLVTAFYPVSSKYGSTRAESINVYTQRFKTTMSLCASYVAFGDADGVQAMRAACPSCTFVQTQSVVTDPLFTEIRSLWNTRTYLSFSLEDRNINGPSYELTLIWHLKLKMLEIAATMVKDEWLIWMDAGLTPFVGLNLKALGSVPSPTWLKSQKGRALFTRVNHKQCAGTCFAVHRDALPLICSTYYNMLSSKPKLQDELLYNDLLHDPGCRGLCQIVGYGYGALLPLMSTNPRQVFSKYKMMCFNFGEFKTVAVLVFAAVVCVAMMVIICMLIADTRCQRVARGCL